MFYTEQHFTLGEVNIHQNITKSVNNRFFYEFLSQCFDQHTTKPKSNIIKSTFHLPKELWPLTNSQKDLTIMTNTKTGKTLVACSTPHLQHDFNKEELKLY